VSDKSRPFSDSDEPDLGEVYLEYYPIGASLKVSAIHAETGVEVSIMAPAKAARADTQRVVLKKLQARLKREGKV
jgi:hypothetical protein